MITEYITLMLTRSLFKKLEDGTVFGEIKGIKGVWANARTVAACKKELREVFEDWLVLQLYTQQRVAGLKIHPSLSKMRVPKARTYA
jgi:predicted RNase H-like HicB family nuclease